MRSGGVGVGVGVGVVPVQDLGTGSGSGSPGTGEQVNWTKIEFNMAKKGVMEC
jgi:hypothetical protein